MLLMKVGLVAVLLLATGAFALRGVSLAELKDWFARGIGLLTDAGPLPYFTAMALLPAAGVPISIFTLTAGPAFGAQLGTVGVLAAAGASLAVNLALTYWLARRWLRPALENLVRRAGYKIPAVEPADQFELTLLLRITPGPPFFLQSYILGLAAIPFRRYFLISWPVVLLQIAGMMIFAQSLAEGKGKLAMLGVSVLTAAALGIHILRRHYAKRKPKAVETHAEGCGRADEKNET
jgi:uncharacterized membrane protein YdjX (TVP38/TMEM64 family)